ncbi:MAG: hypothetical protein HND53_11085 [Proteobacteria bacterium]|nr:hypothetical protein [Pseudomonadota bacterium]NOG61037.1 hypothetical protein [Pseudomonadota bacterium]
MHINTLLFFLLFSISLPTIAAECFGDSPGKTDGSYITPETVPSPLNSQQVKIVRKLFKELNGRWTGDAAYIFCKGKKSSFKELGNEFYLESKVKSDKDELTLNTTLKYKNKNKSKVKKLSIYINDNLLRHDDKGTGGNVSIISIEKNKIHYVKKHASNAGLEEIAIILRKVKSEFVLEQQKYVRGELASKELWILKK